jgi:hypothetical protein
VATRHDSRARPARARPKRRRSSGLGSAVAGRFLISLAEQLETIYSVSVTVQAALAGQNAEQDLDLARCLRVHVSDVVARVARETRSFARHFMRHRRLEAGVQRPSTL